MLTVLAALLGYLAGSIPFAYLLSRQRGIDLRTVGSGNVGATNVWRSSGIGAAIVAVCLDVAKGAAAVALAEGIASGPTTAVTAGLASIVGHMFPMWIGFKGGKGVATAAGVFVLLAPVAMAVAAGVFLVAVIVSGYISLGSLAGAIALAAIALATATPLAVGIGAVLDQRGGVVHRRAACRSSHQRARQFSIR